MNDCPNADVRDLLPELVHHRLDAGARASVMAHVATCTDCALELALLKDLLGARSTPHVDVAAIVAAVPAYRAAPRRSWAGWRIAAAITVLVAGGSSVAVLQRDGGSAAAPKHTAVALPGATPSAPVELPSTTAASAPRERTSKETPVLPLPQSTPTGRAGAVHATRELAMGAGTLNDLDDHELASLLKDIESLDAVPTVEVDNTPVSPIAPRSSSLALP